MKRLLLLLVALATLSLAAAVDPCQPDGRTCFGQASIQVWQNGELVGTTEWNATKEGSTGIMQGTNYEWSLQWNVDPFIIWTFSTGLSGNYVVAFSIPVVPAAYNQVFNSVGYTIANVSARLDSISNVQSSAEVPSGNAILAGLATAPNGTVGFGNNTNSGNNGGPVAFPPVFANSMTARVSFDYANNGDGNAALNGTMIITAVPEPTTGVLASAALLLLGTVTLGRRRRS
jgi:hypothetical protein